MRNFIDDVGRRATPMDWRDPGRLPLEPRFGFSSLCAMMKLLFCQPAVPHIKIRMAGVLPDFSMVPIHQLYGDLGRSEQ